MFKKVRETMSEEHSGAVAFEYIIILVIMAVALFTGFRMLTTSLTNKADQVSSFIDNNGQSELSKGNHTTATH